ncbi:MAG: hypothetical protein HQ538_02025 [Parcubacteria group bacterium]|nr:hypothetical protein [Parcubacteria group bacterium]
MPLKAKSKFEKFVFYIMGFKNYVVPLSHALPKEHMATVSNFWLAKSNTSTVFSTILLTSAIVLFIETKNLILYVPSTIGSVYFAIRVWFCEKCAYHALKLWT